MPNFFQCTRKCITERYWVKLILVARYYETTGNTLSHKTKILLWLSIITKLERTPCHTSQRYDFGCPYLQNYRKAHCHSTQRYYFGCPLLQKLQRTHCHTTQIYYFGCPLLQNYSEHRVTQHKYITLVAHNYKTTAKTLSHNTNYIILVAHYYKTTANTLSHNTNILFWLSIIAKLQRTPWVTLIT